MRAPIARLNGSRSLTRGSRSLTVAAALFALAAVPALAAAASKSPVADAVMKGDKAALRAALQQKADVNAPQVDGATALHWAVYRDDAEAADLVIKAGAKADVKNREGVTPLAMASLYGSAAMVERLLAAGADAKQHGANGETMVMLAARNGNPAVIKRLVAGGGDVNAKEPLRGTTALMWAAEQRHAAAVKMLLELGADHAAKSGPAGLPRNYMAPRVNTAAVKDAQRRYGAAVAAGRTYEEQLEFEAAQGGKISMGFRGPLIAGRRPDLLTGSGTSPATPPGAPVSGAAASGAAATAPSAPAPTSVATPAGAPSDALPAPAGDDDADVIIAGLVGTGGGGLTALTFAAREGDVETTRYLLDGGANINQATEYGWTPLLTATNNRHYKLGALLMEHGADPNIANKGGWTPIYLATDNRNIEGGDYPVPKPDMDHLDYIRMLLDHGADPNARAKDNTLTRTIFTMQWFYEAGCTPFVRAAQSSDTALMRLLLDYGADPFMTTDNGDTALTAAGGIGWVEGVTYERSAKENFEAIRMLLDDLGLDPNIANKEGRTPLMGAALKGRNDVIEMLVAHGARLDQRDGGSRDTDTNVSAISGHTWQALDYADGLVRVGVQSAVQRPETAALLRKMMTDRGMAVPPPNRVIESICVVELCAERVPKK
jgi:ankyrin repeat protein